MGQGGEGQGRRVFRYPLKREPQAGQIGLAVPAALHLLAVYPPKTISRREVRLWAVVEALIEQERTEIRKIPARWLALRPSVAYRSVWGSGGDLLVCHKQGMAIYL